MSEQHNYEINIKDYINLYHNVKIRAVLEGLADAREPNRQYRICQLLIEAINIQFLTERGITLCSSDIIVIEEEYSKFDDDLSKLAMRLNGLYNIYDEQGTVDYDDVDYLLYQTDKLYAIIVERYGGIGDIPFNDRLSCT